MQIEEQLQRLTGIVESLAASVVARDGQIDAHDRQIGALIDMMAEQKRRLDQLTESVAKTERQWQAYVNRLPRQ